MLLFLLEVYHAQEIRKRLLLNLMLSENPESRKLSLRQIRASSSDDTSTSLNTNGLFSDLKEKWDGVENQSTVLVYGGGVLVAIWLSSTLVGAINSVPFLPKIMELVGLGYTGWFVYRYLLSKIHYALHVHVIFQSFEFGLILELPKVYWWRGESPLVMKHAYRPEDVNDILRAARQVTDASNALDQTDYPSPYTDED
ncbi:protein CURVATURE THYLAKOID 1B, chloroplastic [Trifolium repens]|nr:protein CURVATURE THYLAKOID 1B, chloroplastic [Trifolium repens]